MDDSYKKESGNIPIPCLLFNMSMYGITTSVPVSQITSLNLGRDRIISVFHNRHIVLRRCLTDTMPSFLFFLSLRT